MLRVAADAIVANSFGANLLALRNGRRVAYWVHSTRSIFLTRQRQPRAGESTHPGLAGRTARRASGRQ